MLLSMPMLRLPFSALLLLLCLTACTTLSPAPTSSPTPFPLITSAPSSTPLLASPTPFLTATPQPPPTATTLPASTRTHYTLRATLDYTSKRLAILETVRYLNTTGEPLDELLLVVEANWTPGLLQLNALTWEDESPAANWTLENNLLRVPLRESVAPNAWLTLNVDYGLALPAQAGVLGYDFRQINLGNWYPFVPPYEPGTGWLAYQRGWVGESFSYDLADFIVELTLTGADQPFIIAASAPADQEVASDQDANPYHFYLPNARSFALSVSPEYHVFRKMVGDVEVLSYAFPEALQAGEHALNTTADALALYSDLFGPYPHKTMTVVQVNFPDGLEFDGLYFMSEQYYWGYIPSITPDNDVQNYLTIIAAHETAHQWWYGLLGNDQAVEPWLDEALAAYTELIFYEHYYPELVEWWWAFRVDYYEPRDCCVNFSIYQYGDPRAYINAVYLRGAYFMRDLRELMGDEAFFAALKTYAERHRNGFVTAQDFWTVIGEYTNEDLTPIRQRYFSGG